MMMIIIARSLTGATWTTERVIQYLAMGNMKVEGREADRLSDFEAQHLVASCSPRSRTPRASS